MAYFKTMLRAIMVLILLCCSSLESLAQSLIKGLVKDQTGEPIIGATVRVAGTNTGTVSDLDGNFSIEAAPNAKLQVSYVGYESQTVAIAGKRFVTIVLKDDSKTLNDVVVIGYGTMKKSDISGSVATVDKDAVMKRVPTNIGQALQGAAAGVLVSQQDGTPDGNSAIRIRGVGTINGVASPLYVVDGVQVGYDANFLNPQDIESIEVLKDASATAIYGSNGANGVIMITTKHGNKGATHVNLTADFGLQTLPYKLKTGNVDQYAASIREAHANDGTNIFNQIWDAQYDGKRTNIDWQKEMTRPALRQQYGLSVSGGGDKSQYSVSLGYLDVNGLIVNSSYNRFSARANMNSKITKWLEVGADLNYVHSASYGSNGALNNNGNMSSLRDLAYMAPTEDYLVNNVLGGEYVHVNLVNPDGTYGTTYQGTSDGWEGNTALSGNPYASQMENGARNRNGHDRVQTTAYLDVTFLNTKEHHLNLKTQATHLYTSNHSNDMTGGHHRYNFIGGSLQEIVQKQDQMLQLSFSADNSYSLGDQTYLTYNFKNANHDLTAMAGFEVNKTWGQWLNSSAKNFTTADNFDISLTNDPTTKDNGGARNLENHTISYFGRLSYVLMDRYIFTGTIRRDGSSNFSSSNRWGTFPSLAGAWRISQEPFMKNVKWVDNFKLRIGWGQTGNAGNMAGKSIAALSGNAAYAFYPANGYSGAFAGNRDRKTGWFVPLIDENLKWETNEMANFGIDFDFCSNWSVSLDYFIKTTKDLLLDRQMRPSAGYTSVYTNYGTIKNKGFEFAIRYHKQVNKDFGFNVALTGSTIKNKVEEMGEPLYNTCSANGAGTLDGSNVQAVSDGVHWNNHSICANGYAVGSYYGYRTDGIIKDEADLNDYLSKVKLSEGTAHVGDYKWKDLNGDKTIDKSDMDIIGNGFPSLNYGINFGANYKNWDFSLYMYGVFGQDILSYSAMRLSTMIPSDDQTVPNLLTDNYQNAFRNGQGSLPRLTLVDGNYNMRCSDAWVKNGDFLRISNIQVGYTLPSLWVHNLGIQNARVYFGIQNLCILSGYAKYGDPEVGQGSVLYTGLDTGRYPMPRTFMAGVNVTF